MSWNHTKCCNVCPTGAVFAYQLYDTQGDYCMASCIKPSEFGLVHKMEPNLKFTKSSTVNPCKKLGYVDYW